MASIPHVRGSFSLRSFILLLLVLPGIAGRTAQAGHATADPQYLIFQITNQPTTNTREVVLDIKNTFGPSHPETGRLLGFGITPLLLMQTRDEMRKIVNEGFDLAEETGLAVFLQCDDMNFFKKDITADASPGMCEWTAFPQAGESHGPLTRFWFNWGIWVFSPALPNFESPDLRQLMAKQLREGVCDVVRERVEKLRQQHREYLFGGLAIGWETHIPDYTPGVPLYNIDSRNPPVNRHENPPVTMQPAEMSQTGYAALHARGWNPAKLRAEAEKRNIGERELTRQLLWQTIHDYTEFNARTAFDVGIPREKIFTHIVAIDSVQPTQSSTIPPIWAAVNRYSTPGFTLSQFSGAIYDVGKLKEKIGEAEPGQQRFAAVESYFMGMGDGESYRTFLQELFGNGATHVVCWGFTDPPSSGYTFPREQNKSIPVVREWLGNKR